MCLTGRCSMCRHGIISTNSARMSIDPASSEPRPVKGAIMSVSKATRIANAKAAMRTAVKAAKAGDMKTAAGYAKRSLALQPAWEVA